MEYKSGLITLSVIVLIFAAMFYFAPDQADFLAASHRETAGAATTTPVLEGDLRGLLFLSVGFAVAVSAYAATFLLARRGKNRLCGLILAMTLGSTGYAFLAVSLPALPANPQASSLLAYFGGVYVYTGDEVRRRVNICSAEHAPVEDCLEALSYMEDRADTLDLRAASIMVVCLSILGFLVGRTLFPQRRRRPISHRPAIG